MDFHSSIATVKVQDLSFEESTVHNAGEEELQVLVIGLHIHSTIKVFAFTQRVKQLHVCIIK